MSTLTEPRESKRFWTLEGGVREVTGYSCKPGCPTMWWCPEVGYSIDESQLFTSEKEALDKAIRNARRELSEIGEVLAKLSFRRGSL